VRRDFHPFLAARVFAFFAFESYLNELGRQLDPDVWARERDFFAKGTYRGTLGKFKYLAEKSEHTYEVGQRPFQTVRQLLHVCDYIAHGRAKLIEFKSDAKRAEDDARGESALRAWGKRDFAERALADVEAVADGLITAARAKFGEWSVGYRVTAFTGISSMGGIDLDESTR
jgi:hypothetical protein